MIAKDWRVIEPMHLRLNNGLNIRIIEDHRAPIVYFILTVRTDALDCRYDWWTPHLFTSRLVLGGKQAWKKRHFIDDIALIGGSINSAAYPDYAAISGFCFSHDIHKALLMLKDIVVNSEFTKKSVQDFKDAELEHLARLRSSPRSELLSILYKELFPDIIYGKLLLSADDIQAITFDKVVEYYRDRYAPDNSSLILVGDIHDNRALRNLVDVFLEWDRRSKGPSRDFVLPIPPISCLAIQRRKRDRAEVIVGCRTPGKNSPNFLCLSVAHQAIRKIIRDRKDAPNDEREGTFVSSSLRVFKHAGVQTILIEGASCKIDLVLEKAAKWIRAVRRKRISKELVQYAKNYLLMEQLLKYDELEAISYELAENDAYGLSIDHMTFLNNYIFEIESKSIENAVHNMFSRGVSDILCNPLFRI